MYNVVVRLGGVEPPSPRYQLGVLTRVLQAGRWTMWDLNPRNLLHAEQALSRTELMAHCVCAVLGAEGLFEQVVQDLSNLFLIIAVLTQIFQHTGDPAR